MAPPAKPKLPVTPDKKQHRSQQAAGQRGSNQRRISWTSQHKEPPPALSLHPSFRRKTWPVVTGHLRHHCLPARPTVWRKTIVQVDQISDLILSEIFNEVPSLDSCQYFWHLTFGPGTGADLQQIWTTQQQIIVNSWKCFLHSLNTRCELIFK